jgi:predicted small lipoprotein YifL
MKRLTFSIAVLAFMFLFSGCGQSGPLYIPGNPSQMAIPPSQETAGEEELEEDSSEPSEID